MKALLNRYISLIAFLVVLIAWEGACRLLEIPQYVLPAPSVIAAAIGDVGLGRWLEHTLATLSVALVASPWPSAWRCRWPSASSARRCWRAC